jgi:hypothetical protein
VSAGDGTGQASERTISDGAGKGIPFSAWFDFGIEPVAQTFGDSGTRRTAAVMDGPATR